ncbi:MAG: hypothetical protein KatS3mg095_0580 [Candidatus Parcubacteria bacterium]|nr:MAG: hypothetical protein KatS3mg095_0580 [Candidatus Parcubacteria bacterium]
MIMNEFFYSGEKPPKRKTREPSLERGKNNELHQKLSTIEEGINTLKDNIYILKDLENLTKQFKKIKPIPVSNAKNLTIEELLSRIKDYDYGSKINDLLYLIHDLSNLIYRHTSKYYDEYDKFRRGSRESLLENTFSTINSVLNDMSRQLIILKEEIIKLYQNQQKISEAYYLIPIIHQKFAAENYDQQLTDIQKQIDDKREKQNRSNRGLFKFFKKQEPSQIEEEIRSLEEEKKRIKEIQEDYYQYTYQITNFFKNTIKDLEFEISSIKREYDLIITHYLNLIKNLIDEGLENLDFNLPEQLDFDLTEQEIDESIKKYLSFKNLDISVLKRYIYLSKNPEVLNNYLEIILKYYQTLSKITNALSKVNIFVTNYPEKYSFLYYSLTEKLLKDFDFYLWDWISKKNENEQNRKILESINSKIEEILVYLFITTPKKDVEKKYSEIYFFLRQILAKNKLVNFDNLPYIILAIFKYELIESQLKTFISSQKTTIKTLNIDGLATFCSILEQQDVLSVSNSLLIESAIKICHSLLLSEKNKNIEFTLEVLEDLFLRYPKGDNRYELLLYYLSTSNVEKEIFIISKILIQDLMISPQIKDNQSFEKLMTILEQDSSGIKEEIFISALIQQIKVDPSIFKGKLREYLKICFDLIRSPSQEIQRLINVLIVDILSSPEPEKVYNNIISILEKNNLPLVAKIYLIFIALHPKNVLESKLSLHVTLKEAKSYLRQRYIIYRDLLKIHLESGNPSLKEYLETLLLGQELLTKAENEGFDKLTTEEKERLKYFFTRLEALYINSFLGRSLKASIEIENLDLENAYQELRKKLRAKEGQSVIDRITQMYLRPLGLSSLSEALNRMKLSKQNAHQRNLNLYQQAQQKNDKSYLVINKGDILKGTSAEYLENHLENGIVAKEFLGVSYIESDATPLDTDAARPIGPKEEKEEITIEEALQRYNVQAYGDIVLVIKFRNQWQETTQTGSVSYDETKYELFVTGATSERHVGIRTGIASTEIDFIIVSDRLMIDPVKLENLFYLIARNGFYIPIVKTTGEVIFTPEMYEQYSKTFNGLARFDRPPLEVKRTNHPEIDNLIKKEIEQMKQTREKIDKLNNYLKLAIDKGLKEFGTYLRNPLTTDIKGADLMNTGSTGRMTNLPDDYDFDFILRIDVEFANQLGNIAQKIKQQFKYQEDNSHYDHSYYQIRLKSISGLIENDQFRTWKELLGENAPEIIDLDIGLTPKSTLVVFGSHDAVIEKLQSIENESDREYIIGAIILVKKLLKQENAYERVAHGGFGGIGVENWLLLYNGNIIEAFKSFIQAAFDGENFRPFEEFKKRYKIFNPGTNIKHMNHDNYIENMTQEGYKAMIKAIINFFNKYNISWQE